MRILVAGSTGQVGRELCLQGMARGFQVIGADRSRLDICDATAVRQFVTEVAPDVIFNAAGWTAVDAAETQMTEAFKVNHEGAANLATACAEHSIPFVHYSTDYVFDGTKLSAYVEDDATCPLGAYGRSKLAGEEAVRQKHEKHLILRTSWIFSAHRNNFVKTMLKLGTERTELSVVADQVGKPTSAATIADVSLAIAGNAGAGWGTYHLAQPEAVSWYEFSKAIFAIASHRGMDLAVKDIVPISSDDYPTAAKRPENSALDCHKLENAFDVVIPDWHESLDFVIGDLLSD